MERKCVCEREKIKIRISMILALIARDDRSEKDEGARIHACIFAFFFSSLKVLLMFYGVVVVGSFCYHYFFLSPFARAFSS